MSSARNSVVAKGRRLCCLLAACLGLGAAARAAEQFGDVSVSADAIYTGSTFHGYAEMRVVLENHSSSHAHSVTLVYPGREGSGYYGNSLSRIARTVKVAPEAREVVSLLQPPLPAPGDGNIRVLVDGWSVGDLRAPNPNNHCNSSWRGGTIMANVLVSRSLDYDAVARLFQANAGSFTAAKATGSPDAPGNGYQPNCWMPDTRLHGMTNWLELDFATPQPVSRVMVYETQSGARDGTVTLIGAGGTNLATLALSAGKSTSISAGAIEEYDFPEGTQAVKSVRLVFNRSVPPYNISIDAVQIWAAGPGNQWASVARASSDNSASSMHYRPGGSPDDAQALRSESPVSEWSENWLAYSPFDAIVLNQGDVAGMRPGVLSGLDDYVQAGGNVFVLGAAQLPPGWRAAQAEKIPGGTAFKAGFGTVFTFDADNPGSLDSVAVQRLRDVTRENVRYFQSLPSDSSAANALMPVVATLKIPARGTVIIMLAFVILIGPVNMLYLNKIKRRTWMLWTVPAISFATTMLVFAYSLVREGITPDARIAGVTVLDQAAHRAATVGGEAFYCPLTPSGGLHFDFATEATPLVETGYGRGTDREVDWTQSQHFERGWVAARVPAHFHLRKPETRRERIQITRDNDRMQIVNSLGAPIKTLWYADADMRLYQADHIPAGEKGALLVSKLPSVAEKTGPDGLLRFLGFAEHSDTLPDSVGKFLLPNTYIAVLDGNPFLENALGTAASPKRTTSEGVVFGIMEDPETAATK